MESIDSIELSEGRKEQLREVVQVNNLLLVDSLLTNYPELVNSIYPKNHNRTILHIAAEQGKVELIKLFIEKYTIDPHAKDSNGWTALHLAAASGKPDVITFLVDKYKLDINAKANYGRTALHMAAASGKPDVITFLVDKYKLDIHAKDNDGWTALLLAADNGHPDVVTFLIDTYKLDIQAKANDGWTALHMAATSGKPDVITFLVDKYKLDIHAKDNDGWTALHMTAANDQPDVITFLIDKYKLDIHAKANNGRTALHVATDYGHPDVITFLVDKYKLDIHAKDNYGWTALHMAAANGNLEVIKLLVEKYTLDPHAKTNYGWTALHMAAEAGNPEVITFLIDKYKLDIQAKDNDGWTALHVAAAYGRLTTVKLLIDDKEIDHSNGYIKEATAAPNEKKGYIDETVLIAAAGNLINDDPIVLKFLLEKTKGIPTLLSGSGEASTLAVKLKEAATSKGNRQIVTFLEEKIADLQESMTIASRATQQRTERRQQLESGLESAKIKCTRILPQEDKNFRDNLYHAYMDYAAFELLPRGNYTEAGKLINNAIKQTHKGFKESLIGSSDNGALAYILAGFVENAKAEEERRRGNAAKQQEYYEHAAHCFERAIPKLDTAEHPLLFIGQAVVLAGKDKLAEAIELREKVKELLDDCSMWIERGSIVEELCQHTIAFIDREEQLVKGQEERERLQREQLPGMKMIEMMREMSNSLKEVRQKMHELPQETSREVSELVNNVRKRTHEEEVSTEVKNAHPRLAPTNPRKRKQSEEKTPSCFVVYAHHAPDEHGNPHRNVTTVRQLIVDLEIRGIDVKSDKGENFPLEGVRAHSERYIDPDREESVDCVIVALSEQLVLKADKEDHVLHEELLMIDERLIKNGRSSIILVQLDAAAEHELHKVCPDIFKTRSRGLKFAVDHLIIKDFVTDDGYAKGLHTLYGALHGRREKELPLVSVDVMIETSSSQKATPINITMSSPSSIPEEITGESSQAKLNRRKGKGKGRA